MVNRDTPYLIDAAKQLETAARKLRKAANANEHLFNRLPMLAEARANVNAALARIENANDQLRAN